MSPVFVRLATYFGNIMSINCPTPPSSRAGLAVWLEYQARLVSILQHELCNDICTAVRLQLELTDDIIEILKTRE
jgi:hypothetical protein